MDETPASTAGDATGTQEIAAVPTSGIPPEASPQGESSPPSIETTPEAEAPPKPTRAQILELAKALPKEELSLLDKDLSSVEDFNAERNRILAQNLRVEAQKQQKQLQDKFDLQQEMGQRLAYFKTPEGQARLLSDDPNVAAAHAEVLAWAATQNEAPIVSRLEQKIEQQAAQNLKAQLAANPALATLATDANWQKLIDAATDAGPGKNAAAIMVAALATLEKSQEARIRAELRAEMEAKISDGVAERVQGMDEPVLVGSGISLNGFKTIAEARLAHIRNEITDDQMRQYIRRFGHE